MRLLNVHSLKLEEFGGEPGSIPPYAILSHTWGRDEVSFREMIADHAALAQRKGFQKIVRCCEKARSVGHDFVWVDTCCIDKSGSAELSEAINSMFRWYRGAEICCAYLDDVCPFEDPTEASSSFRKSRWFTRGWTLQELLAPYEVVFLDRDWQEIGTKQTLSDMVSSQTQIDKETLEDCTWRHVSIAAKMSWASSRVTKRVEDMAYCLMGLFDVNMPLIYGEGSKAFYRLQLEIMKSSDDQSIFAWIPDVWPDRPALHGLLAQSPEDFKLSHKIVDCTAIGGDTLSYDVSKQYVRLSTPMLDLFDRPFPKEMQEWQPHSQFLPPNEERSTATNFFARIAPSCPVQWDRIKMAVLCCKDEVGYISIPLKQLESGEFERFAYTDLRWLRTRTIDGPIEPTHPSILVRAVKAPNADSVRVPSAPLGRPHHFPIASLSIHESGYFISGGYPPNFITVPGQRPTHVEAISRINQAFWFVTPVIVFFAHNSPTYPPFALRLYRLGSSGNYAIYVRMGAAINEWEEVTGLDRPQEEEKLVGSYEQIFLSEEKSLFIRTRKMAPGPRVHDFVNISIGPRLSWQQQIPVRSSSVLIGNSERHNSRRDGTSDSTASMNGHSSRLLERRGVGGGRILRSRLT